MKYYRVATAAGPRWARLDADALRLLSAPPWEAPRETGEHAALAGAKLLAPGTPSKIVAIGLNYRDHAAERNAPIPSVPLIFLKPPSALLDPGEPIRRPAMSTRVDHEAELGIVIGRRVSGLRSEAEAAAAVFGATCVNDITARDLQDQDVQFTRAKGFDTFCPIGPCLATGLDLARLDVVCRVNGAVRQKSNTAQLIFPVPALVAFVSNVMTLLPGDIISTGTPSGISPLEAGDRVEVEVEGVGVLVNPVV